MADWERFREEMDDDRRAMWGDDGFLYRLRTRPDSDPLDRGPYSFTVRDCLVRPADEGLHDYLACPEIVQDISRACQQAFGIDLERRFIDATVPCIVKLRHEPLWPGALEDALWYVYSYAREGKVFDAGGGPPVEGTTIAPGRVVKVEVLTQ